MSRRAGAEGGYEGRAALCQRRRAAGFEPPAPTAASSAMPPARRIPGSPGNIRDFDRYHCQTPQIQPSQSDACEPIPVARPIGNFRRLNRELSPPNREFFSGKREPTHCLHRRLSNRPVVRTRQMIPAFFCSSPPRKRGSRRRARCWRPWVPAFAGMTKIEAGSSVKFAPLV
jgi:hypothetical protein